MAEDQTNENIECSESLPDIDSAPTMNNDDAFTITDDTPVFIEGGEEDTALEVQNLTEEVNDLKGRLFACEDRCSAYSRDLEQAEERQKQLEANERDLRKELDEVKNAKEDRAQEVSILRDRLSNFVLDEITLKDQDQKVKFYTGLPTYTLLMHVFALVSEQMEKVASVGSSKCGLTKFQEFFIVLMRFRLGLLEQDLAYRFNVSQSTVSRICSRWLLPLSHSLKRLLCWPDRETLRKTTPMCFQKSFGKSVAVIIDCFEIFIERPSSLSTRAGTWSQYKHHNTVKFLIGITPQGTTSFISKAWVGRTSDKHLTENSGILDKLLPNDVILADRGFNIDDSVGFVGAKLVMPAFTKGKHQLSHSEVSDTRKIANVRIHVERLIGLTRNKYRILSTTLTVDLLITKPGESEAPIDHIVQICCALVNLCGPIVPM